MAGSSIRRLRISRRLRRVILIALGVWLIGCCGLALVIDLYGLPDRAQPEDVIIVLGSGLNADLTPGHALTRRSVRAAELWKAGYAPMIICSGGYSTTPERSEADGCAEVLSENGVPSDAIILERQSLSTEENAIYSHPIMRDHGWNTALLVSDGYHLLRATWLFSNEGISGSTSPAAQPPLFDLIFALIREVVAFHWQVFKTVLGLPVTYVPIW